MNTTERRQPLLEDLNVTGNIYEKFLPDQILTHNNLNKITDYFEDQDRLTRVYGLGVGIGCGLQVTLISPKKIKIGSGFGITTDGDLITHQANDYTHYADLHDKAKYPVFKDLKSIVELFTEGAIKNVGNPKPLSSLGKVEEYVVLLYVESFTQDQGACSGLGCDQTGNKVYANTKMLLVHKDELAALVSADTILNKHNMLSVYDELPELCVPRVLLNKENTTTKIMLHNLFKEAIIKNNLPEQLLEAMTISINAYGEFSKDDQVGDYLKKVTEDFRHIFNFSNDYQIDIQYKYDLLKDLVETYGEIRDLLVQITFECFPDLKAFPKHLLLGYTSKANTPASRHNFYPSPIVTNNDKRLSDLNSLIIRFCNQLQQYKFPVKDVQIKITPTKSYLYKLADRAIPYYYRTDNKLIENWNNNVIGARKLTRQLGYHSQNLENIDCVQFPLIYCHLDKDFYRIEGHVNKDLEYVLNKVKEIKSDYNLPFDLKAVGFDNTNGDSENQVECHSKIHLLLLQYLKAEFKCAKDNALLFLKNYHYRDLGNNTSKTTRLVNLRFKRIGRGGESSSVVGKPVKEDILADAFEYSVQEVGKSDARDIYDTAVAYVDEQLGDEKRESDLFLMYVQRPLNLMAHLHVIDETLNELIKLNDFSTNAQSVMSKFDTFSRVTKTAVYDMSRHKKDGFFESFKHDVMYEHIVHELDKLCCIKERFGWLSDELTKLPNEVNQKLLLSELIQKFQGLEHMAGVPKGGTFFVVYNKEDSVKDDDFVAKKSRKVLFDFALPYMCKSECPPEVVVFNSEIITSLSISPTVYCFDDVSNKEDTAFEISPAGASLTSPQGEGFIKKQDNTYSFVPTEVPESLYGQDITFLVNDKAIPNLALKVYRLPKTLSIRQSNIKWTKNTLTIDFEANLHDFTPKDYLHYNWYDKNKTWEKDATNANGKITQTFNVSGDNFKTSVNLVVSVLHPGATGKAMATVIVTEKRPSSKPVEGGEGREDDNSYTFRTDNLKIPSFLQTAKTNVENEDIGEKYIKNVHEPLDITFNGLRRSNIKSFSDANMLNEALTTLTNIRVAHSEFLNPNQNKEVKDLFINMEEVIELIGLEMMRLVKDVTAKKTVKNLQGYFNHSSNFTQFMRENKKQRLKITTNYLNDYKTEASATVVSHMKGVFNGQ